MLFGGDYIQSNVPTGSIRLGSFRNQDY